VFPWRDIFRGRGVDVGCGPDQLPFPGCEPFDKEQGDANHLSRHLRHNTFDYLHSSQSLEHMLDPAAALADWLKVLKRGGHAVVTVPSWELYEGMVWPSRYNPDHKSTFSMSVRGSPAPAHACLPGWLGRFHAEVLLCRLVDTNYEYAVGVTRDQTWDESDGVEAFIEFVLRRK
jgi:SAM-dependent methyltransferase